MILRISLPKTTKMRSIAQVRTWKNTNSRIEIQFNDSNYGADFSKRDPQSAPQKEVMCHIERGKSVLFCFLEKNNHLLLRVEQRPAFLRSLFWRRCVKHVYEIRFIAKKYISPERHFHCWKKCRISSERFFPLIIFKLIYNSKDVKMLLPPTCCLSIPAALAFA